MLVVLLAPPSLGLPAYLVRPLPSREELRLRPSGRPFTISVEGNVGAGKSTLLKYFQKVDNRAGNEALRTFHNHREG